MPESPESSIRPIRGVNEGIPACAGMTSGGLHLSFRLKRSGRPESPESSIRAFGGPPLVIPAEAQRKAGIS